MFGLAGDDQLFGGDSNDSLYGGNGADYLGGGLGDDYYEGGLGTDFLSDDGGTDIAGYYSSRTTYSVTYSDGIYTIYDNSGVEGTDYISGVEYFNFNGTIISASNLISYTDTTAPTVSTFSPADGASSVSVGSNIVLTFSEAVTKGTGNVQLRVGSATGTVFETFDAATSSRLTFSGNTLTIDPTNSLAGGTNYYVTLASGSVKDTAGNSYIGTTTYDLTTAQSTVDYTAYIEAIYLAYYGRPADVTGLVFWNTALNTVNGDLASIINSFGTAAEATALYSSSSNIAKINAIYMALFNRPADAEGLIYYASLLENGTKSQASIALDILNGSTGDDLALILKKLQVSADFTSAMKSDATFMIAYAGNTAAATARSMLSAVTLTSDDSSVVDITLNTIQTITADGATLSAQTFTLSYAGANAGNDLAPETAGRDYHVGQITTKLKTVGQVLAEISDSTENKLAVADLIGTGIEYTPWVD